MANTDHAGNTVRFAAVGDICLARTRGRQVQQKGFEWPFGALAPVLRSADLLFGNMESVVLPPDYPDEIIDPWGLVSKFDGTPA